MVETHQIYISLTTPTQSCFSSFSFTGIAPRKPLLSQLSLSVCFLEDPNDTFLIHLCFCYCLPSSSIMVFQRCWSLLSSLLNLPIVQLLSYSLLCPSPSLHTSEKKNHKNLSLRLYLSPVFKSVYLCLAEISIWISNLTCAKKTLSSPNPYPLAKKKKKVFLYFLS